MKKCKRCMAVGMVLLLALGVTPAFSSGISDYKFSRAYENVEYKTGDLMFSHRSNYDASNAWTGGDGWNGGWYPSVGAPAGDKPSIASRNDELWLHNYKATTSMSRKLAAPINTEADGEYYMTFQFYDSGATDLTKVNNKIGFGDINAPVNGPALYGGLCYNREDGGYHLQLGVDEKVIYDDRKFAWNDFNGQNNNVWQMKLHLHLDADGEDMLRMKAWRKTATEPDAWQLSLPCELTGQTLDMMDIRNNGTGGGINSIVIEGISGNEVSNIAEVFRRIEVGDEITRTEAAEAMVFIRDIAGESTVMLKSLYNDLLMPCIIANGWEDIAAVSLTESTITPDNPVCVDDADSIILTFSGAVVSSGIPQLKKADGTAVKTQIAIEENKITISLEEKLEPLNKYCLDLSGVKDTLGIAVTPQELVFSTGPVPSVNLQNGAEYGEGIRLVWTDLPEVAVTAQLDGKPIANGEQIFGVGERTLTIVASHEGKQVSRTITIFILEAFAPEVTNVAISGNAETGAVVTGTYVFSDKNNDAESGSVYKWYRCSSEQGEYVQIEGANQKDYTLTEQDEDCYLQFEVTPVADSLYASVGTAVRSEAFLGAFRPDARNVRIVGNAKPGETLSIQYDYYDANEDASSEPLYRWYCANRRDGEYALLENETKAELVITEAHFEQYIRAGVVAVSDKKPYAGQERFTEPVAAPAKPVVSNVVIGGTARVGEVLTAQYDFYDINGDEEFDSVLTWIDTSNGNTVGTGPVLHATSAMQGKNVALKVAGMSANEPKAAEPVVSEGVTIRAQKSSGSGGGGGNQLRGTGSNSAAAPSEPVSTTPAPSQPPARQERFSDIAGHWAETFISALADAEVVNGTAEGQFEPERAVTRAELVAMLMRTLDGEAAAYEPIYADVSPEDWFADAVMWAYAEGVISPDALFRPNDNITREETAKLLSYATDRIEDGELPYRDINEISDWAVKYVKCVYAHQLMTGDDEERFRPKSAITRAEAAAVLYRICGEATL